MDLLNDVLDLIQKFVIIGGGVLLVFGLVNLAQASVTTMALVSPLQSGKLSAAAS